MKELIKTHINDVVRKMAPGFRDGFSIDIPENKAYGDYTANAAFILAKKLKKSPKEIAEDIASRLQAQELSDFSNIEAKGGFVNFFLSREYLVHQARQVLKEKSKYGFTKEGRGKKVQVEFISANPTGPLTVGNGRGGFFGDVLANVLSSQGYKVAREYYINDKGVQVLALGRSIKMAQGFKVSDADAENIYRGEYIKDLAKKISKKLDEVEAGKKAVELVLRTYIRPVVEKELKIKFDKWFSERSLYPPSRKASEGRGQKGEYEKVFKALMQTNLVYEKDGATWMATSKLGDGEDRVLIKSDGAETYFLSDILYHWNKFKKRKFNKVIDIWGADHHGYVPRLRLTLEALGIDLEKIEILITQLVRLVKDGREVKVSKRAGTFVTLKELVDEVGLDASRYFFLASSLNNHMDFDLALAKQKSEKNPVYYIQYSHARLSSILKKAKTLARPADLSFLSQDEELGLIRKLVEFPELLKEISKTYGVHNLARYSLELAKAISAFYRDVRVLQAPAQEKKSRLALVMSARTVLANTLGLMGIKAPEKM